LKNWPGQTHDSHTKKTTKLRGKRPGKEKVSGEGKKKKCPLH